MALEKFTTEALSRIDGGRIAAAFELALKRAEVDCKDRPAVKKARRVELIATIEPILGPDGELDSCDVSFTIKDSIPKRESKVFNMTAARSGLMFNEMSAEDARQKTLDEVDAGPRKVVTNVG